MDLTMSIASMSVDMHAMQAQQALSVSVLKTAMNMNGECVADLLASAEAVNLDPIRGSMVDVQA